MHIHLKHQMLINLNFRPLLTLQELRLRTTNLHLYNSLNSIQFSFNSLKLNQIQSQRSLKLSLSHKAILFLAIHI